MFSIGFVKLGKARCRVHLENSRFDAIGPEPTR
jgi:hypothetical protein